MIFDLQFPKFWSPKMKKGCGSKLSYPTVIVLYIHTKNRWLNSVQKKSFHGEGRCVPTYMSGTVYQTCFHIYLILIVAPPTQGTWRSDDYVNAFRLVDYWLLLDSMKWAERVLYSLHDCDRACSHHHKPNIINQTSRSRVILPTSHFRLHMVAER